MQFHNGINLPKDNLSLEEFISCNLFNQNYCRNKRMFLNNTIKYPILPRQLRRTLNHAPEKVRHTTRFVHDNFTSISVTKQCGETVSAWYGNSQ